MSLKHAILTLLDADDSSGYDLLKRFRGGMGFFWNASHQQIYQQLKTLHREGLVDVSVEAQDSRPDRKVYRITDDGRAELRRWLAEPVKAGKINDALLVKIYAGDKLPAAELVEELARHRIAHEERLQTFLALEADYRALATAERRDYRLPYLTLRRGILGEQAWLAWADEVERALAEGEW